MPIDPALLRQIPLFALLDSNALLQVAGMLHERHYERGEIIFLEGNTGGALHYVLSGLIKIFKTSAEGKEQVLHLIQPGKTFNDVPAFDGGPNPASAAAVEKSIVYVLNRTQLQHLIAERPMIATAAVQTLASALRHMVALVEDLSFRHVTGRVAKILLNHHATMPMHRLTQQEMAGLAGTAREVIARALKELEMAGAITIENGHVQISDRDRLRLFV